MLALARPGVAAASAIALAAAGLSGSASASTGVRLVGHQTHTVTGSGVHAVERVRTVVTGVTGVSAVVSRRVAADLDRRTAKFVVPPRGQDGPFDLEDKLVLAHADARYVTVNQDTYYYSGGAHGESANLPLTYSATTGKLLTVRSFAAKGKLASLLKVLSVQSRKVLAAQGITADFFKYGTTPTYVNFEDFEPLPTGWRVEFPQGDVADEAHGPLHVTVPWSALKGLIALPLPTA